jgi:hypothetical protein
MSMNVKPVLSIGNIACCLCSRKTNEAEPVLEVYEHNKYNRTLCYDCSMHYLDSEVKKLAQLTTILVNGKAKEFEVKEKKRLDKVFKRPVKTGGSVLIPRRSLNGVGTSSKTAA